LQEKQAMENLQNDQPGILIKQNAFYKSSLNKDREFMVDNLHDEFVFTSPRAVVMNKQSFINDFVSNPDVHLEIFESLEENIRVVGTTAISTGIVQARFQKKDVFKVRVTLIFVYNEDWKILAFQETFIP